VIHTPSARISKIHFHVAVVCLLFVIGDVTLAAQNRQFKGVVRTEASNSSAMEVQFWTGDEQLRIDITNPMKMSVVWSFGAEPSMRMIQHDEKVYVEWGPLQLENARQMMQRANLGQPTVEIAPLQFEETGARETVDGKDVFEVRLQTAENEEGSRLWLSRDADYGLAEFFAHYARALNGTTQFPMTGTDNDPLGLVNGLSLPLDQLDSTSDLDGRVVRIVDDDSGREPPTATTISLHSLESGPFSAELFDVPDGYVRKPQLGSNVQ
jgi:hypothetical protein